MRVVDPGVMHYPMAMQRTHKAEQVQAGEDDAE
jgi:hypothetical protein